MSNNVAAILRKETEFALLAFMEIPSNIKQQLTTSNAQFWLLISKTWPLVVDIRHVTCAEKHLIGVQSKL
ncbi:hypothetical protein HanXRQr2_Chr12g0524091 [Helianthus annuus]|uniref:Uncharacterized protein n=1 Tax=Helianthus annuus TaxID=4232 RepID=A0A251SDA6_HELAN|nr:hypothetical protein HanXRQr2_Chr12g0524091 [Helianthus annuus]KAJ0861293.1 hypothetical protein HanPSC8_Chr12g0505021 [Helianthus annuus]